MYHGIEPPMNQETAQNRKKLLFVVTKSNWGGAQRYVFDLATQLKEMYDVSVLSGDGEGEQREGSLMKKLNQEGIRTLYLAGMQRNVRIVRDIRVFFQLLRTFRRERPDIAHLNSSKAGGLGALAARIARVPRIVFTSHGLAYDEPRSWPSRFLIAVATWLTFLLAHRVICISTDTARRARRLPFCRSRVALVHNGPRPIQFIPRKEARERLSRYTSNIDPDATWIGTISELVPNKNLAYALRACAALKRTGVKFVFLIIGEGYLRPTLEAAIAKRELSDTVRLLGFVPEARELLKAFDISTLTSRKEGLPYVLLESGSAGVAVAATDIPGIRDIVENGVSGALVSPDDPQMFADALIELIEDASLRERFGAALQKKMQEEFSLENMVRETIDLYEKTALSVK